MAAFLRQQLSLTWIVTSAKPPPYGLPGRLETLTFRNAPVCHVQGPAKRRRSSHTKSRHTSFTIHSGCHHTECILVPLGLPLTFVIQFKELLEHRCVEALGPAMPKTLRWSEKGSTFRSIWSKRACGHLINQVRRCACHITDISQLGFPSSRVMA